MKISIGNAPCSWGAFELNGGLSTPDYPQVLDEMHAAGYRGTELGDWGFMPTDQHKLQDELASRELELISAFVPIPFCDKKRWAEGLSTALRTAELLATVSTGKAVLVLSDDNGSNPIRTRQAGRIKPEMGLLPLQWGVFTQGVEYVSRTVFEQTGLKSVFHHHCAGYVETAAEIGMFLDYADPAWVDLCLDTGHFRFAGGDPTRIFRNFADRVKLVHFKDCSPAIAAQSRTEGWDYHTSLQHGVFCELGQGDVDFPAIKTTLEGIGYQGWIVVEQDILPGMGSPLESAIRNREYLHRMGL